jgi:hypothetical protein
VRYGIPGGNLPGMGLPKNSVSSHFFWPRSFVVHQRFRYESPQGLEGGWVSGGRV